jgi:hypothetical protein
MFKNLTDILAADCEVIKFNDEQFFYPIFKNGRSSLKEYAEDNNLDILKNKKISSLKKITVFLREPKERFISGVYTFFYFTNNKVIDDTILKKIENCDVIDRHFVPQYIWLFHLYKYFKGLVEFRPVSDLYELIPNRGGPWGRGPAWKPLTEEKKLQILSIDYKKYLNVDKKILKKYMYKTIKLKTLINEFKLKNVLS